MIVLASISLKALKFVKTQSQQKMKGETENGINILKFVIVFSSFKKNKEFFYQITRNIYFVCVFFSLFMHCRTLSRKDFSI